MPPFGVPARVELLPRFAAGLRRLEKHSHVWVFGWFDRAERDLLEVTPRGVADHGPEGLHGVFAVRSPARPNPIGLTAARIVRIESAAIEVDRLDFLDGTPVVDLKPYFASRDLIFSASNQSIGRPADREALRESLLFQAERFHGERCGDLELGVRIVAHFRAEVLDMEEIAGWRIAVPLGRPCLVDTLMGTTRATPGRRTLAFQPDDCVVFERGDRRVVYDLAVPEPELFRPRFNDGLG